MTAPLRALLAAALIASPALVLAQKAEAPAAPTTEATAETGAEHAAEAAPEAGLPAITVSEVRAVPLVAMRARKP